ncbi:MAG TPA: hypothetical protein DDW98_02470 [Gammaproteobacteria bacterium]|nr:hypothetical protein [Gammaproteobacteria bacterium]
MDTRKLFREEGGGSGQGGSVRADDVILDILFPDRDGKRMRKVVSRSRARMTGKVPSRKLGRMVQWESRIERMAIFVAETDPTIERYQEQPCEIRYRSADGMTRRHIPDFLIERAAAREIWEIKADREAESEEVTARTQLLTAPLARRGFRYRLVPESDLARIAKTCEALVRYAADEVLIEHVDVLRAFWSDDKPRSWAAAEALLSDRQARSVIARLVLDGVLRVALDQPIEAETELRWAHGQASSPENLR